MMRWLGAGLVFVLAALGAHYVTLKAVPGAIMKRAHAALEQQGVVQYRWAASPRQTPQTQRIVRPSPDLSYAVCRFDVQSGPVTISAPGWEGYGSLSVFDGQTNNVFVGNLNGEDGRVVVLSADDANGSGVSVPAGVKTVAIKGPGIALIRRLAPDEATHEIAAGLVGQAVCERLAGG